jgi:hypothetical protein
MRKVTCCICTDAMYYDVIDPTRDIANKIVVQYSLIYLDVYCDVMSSDSSE